VGKVFEVAASVSTPLALGGLFAAVLFFILKQILAKNIYPKLSRDHGAAFLKHVVDRLFTLALVAMVLGFAGFVIGRLPQSKTAEAAEQGSAVGSTTSIAKPVVYKTCQDPSFGRNGWQHSEVVDQSSGWRGGGGSQQAWCNELAASFIQRHSIGSDREIEVLGSHESHKRDVVGRVEYNYTCRLRISWGSIWNSRRDPLCGVED
jgi:hypothetical protein